MCSQAASCACNVIASHTRSTVTPRHSPNHGLNHTLLGVPHWNGGGGAASAVHATAAIAPGHESLDCTGAPGLCSPA